MFSTREAGGQELTTWTVQPGDTWAALALRRGVAASELQRLNPHPNRQRQPIIGREVILPAAGAEKQGRLLRPLDGGLLATALRTGVSPWLLAAANGLERPSSSHLLALLWIPGEGIPRELPAGFQDLTLSHVPARAGEGMAFTAAFAADPGPLDVSLGTAVGSFHYNPNTGRGIGLLATGAFFEPGAPELVIAASGKPLWAQPWGFGAKEWTFNQITLTGSAAEISQEEIQAERERLFTLWSEQSPAPLWTTSFVEPVTDYLQHSSLYGARRSYNGGPYRTYHEGLDFAAYGGTPVRTPAGGTVVLAEQLYVRGGAVIVDHGLGIYSGYYHLSAVHVEAGRRVEAEELIGEVGTTGLSTGNHLHWDLLVNGIWVDPQAWLDDGMACWLLAAWGSRCSEEPGG